MKAFLILFFSSVSLASKVLAFPSSPLIDRQVWFWEQVFLHYHNQEIIIHDSDHPEIIVDVIDLTQYQFADDDEEDQWIDDLLDRYQKGINNFRMLGPRAYYQGSIERRLHRVYKSKPKLLVKGKRRLRTQRGLKDVFEKAIVRAIEYLPAMEQIFTAHGLPKELTRLPFVESMFNFEARSKVGASGIWQFMPATGRRYLNITPFIDERNSPLKATLAAAQLLKRNYQALGSWPLAITAYNHGLNGIRRAVRRTKSNRLTHLIKNYRSSTFGFASKNFYAEFLAARKAFSSKYKDRLWYKEPANLARVTLSKPLSLAQLIRSTPLTSLELQKLNRCMSRDLFSKGLHKPLPKNYSFWVPKAKYNRVRKRLSLL